MKKFASEWMSDLATHVILTKEMIINAIQCYFLEEFSLKLPTVYFNVKKYFRWLN